jgi:hypothetical protein
VTGICYKGRHVVNPGGKHVILYVFEKIIAQVDEDAPFAELEEKKKKALLGNRLNPFGNTSEVVFFQKRTKRTFC